jgi:hypothetical protein
LLSQSLFGGFVEIGGGVDVAETIPFLFFIAFVEIAVSSCIAAKTIPFFF